MMLVLLQLLLRQSEDLFTHQRRHRHFDPVLAGPFMAGAVAAHHPVALTQGPRDALSRPQLCLAITSSAPIGRIPQQAPYRRAFPASGSGARGDLALIE